MDGINFLQLVGSSEIRSGDEYVGKWCKIESVEILVLGNQYHFVRTMLPLCIRHTCQSWIVLYLVVSSRTRKGIGEDLVVGVVA